MGYVGGSQEKAGRFLRSAAGNGVGFFKANTSCFANSSPRFEPWFPHPVPHFAQLWNGNNNRTYLAHFKKQWYVISQNKKSRGKAALGLTQHSYCHWGSSCFLFPLGCLANWLGVWASQLMVPRWHGHFLLVLILSSEGTLSQKSPEDCLSFLLVYSFSW